MRAEHEAMRSDIEFRKQKLELEHQHLARGQVVGAMVALGGFVATGVAAWLDHPWVAGIVGAFDIVALAAVFVTGKYLERQSTAPPQQLVK